MRPRRSYSHDQCLVPGLRTFSRRYNWRAGASQPSRPIGAIFLYNYMFLIGTVRRICACVMLYVILNIRTALKFPETLWALVGHLRADDSSTVATEGRRL